MRFPAGLRQPATRPARTPGAGAVDDRVISARSKPIRIPLGGRPGEPPSSRSVLRIVGIVLAVAALLWLVYVSRTVLTWLAVGAFFAVAINPLVTLFERRMRIPRAGAIVVVYLVVLLLIAGLALLFVPPMIQAAQELTDTVPGYVDQVQNSSLVERLDEE